MRICNNSGLLLTALSISIISIGFGSANAQTMSDTEKTDKGAAKQSNIDAAERLNGTAKPTDAKTAKDKQEAHDTAKVVNQVPGVKVDQKDLEPPSNPPIKGFHPIKRLLQPVENLEGMSIKLEQQIMKLEGPIAALQPPMIGLQKKMTGVDDQLGKMQGQLNGTQQQVVGVRSDLANMRKDIADLKEPIVAIRAPLAGVSKPLEAVEAQLNLVLLAILIAAVAIAFGTPLAAILIYRNRYKLFPDLQEHELPKVEPGTPTPARSRSV